jgi:hypothetical protein
MARNLIQRTEDALLSEAKAATRGLCHTYATCPADWDQAIAEQLLQAAPAVYCAFLRWRKREGYYAGPKNAEFALYILIADGTDEMLRRRGDAYAIGAYGLAEMIDAAIDGCALVDADANALGTPSVDGLDNLFTVPLWDLGATCYGLSVSILLQPDPLPNPDDLASDMPPGLIDRVHTDWDVPPLANAAAHARWLAGDRTTLPPPDAQDDVAL